MIGSRYNVVQSESQGCLSGNRLTHFSLKMSKNLWYLGGTICSSVRLSFFRFSTIAKSVANVTFEQIHTLFVSGLIHAPSSMICSLISIKGQMRVSLQLVPKALIVHVIHLSWSSSSEIVGLGKGLARRASTFFLKSNFWGMWMGCHWKVVRTSGNFTSFHSQQSSSGWA